MSTCLILVMNASLVRVSIVYNLARCFPHEETRLCEGCAVLALDQRPSFSKILAKIYVNHLTVCVTHSQNERATCVNGRMNRESRHIVILRENEKRNINRLVIRRKGGGGGQNLSEDVVCGKRMMLKMNSSK